MVAFYLFLCFLMPLVWLTYAAFVRRSIVKYALLFFVSSLISVIAASLLQTAFQAVFSEIIIFSGGRAVSIFLYSFIQTGFMEEAAKAFFFFFILNKINTSRTGFVGRSESAVFYFAVFSGLLFASFETLAGYFYLPGATVPRMFTTYVLHPLALLVTASGVFFDKRFRGGAVLAFLAGFLVHGFYNLVVVFFMRSGAVVYTAVMVVSVIVLWWKIGGSAIFTGERDIIPPQE